MRTLHRNLLIAAAAITLIAIGVWAATGRDFYTKFEVVEEVEKKVDPNDPFAGTGFYDSNTAKQIVRRKEFRLGLLPTPSGLFDKHMVSVVTLTGPVWGIALAALIVGRRRNRQGGSPASIGWAKMFFGSPNGGSRRDRTSSSYPFPQEGKSSKERKEK